ncbi:MAG: transcription termination/antitermination protein NusG, partial [bacterium]
MAKQQIQEGRNWYAIHTYAGYENAVARNLKQRIESLNMGDKIFNVVVPIEKKIKIKGTKRVEEEEKIYPGYILVDMIVNDDSWYVVRNTPRVTGFVGAGVYPVPLSQKEIDSLFSRMANETVKHNTDLLVNDQVKIADGPFK